MAKNKFYAVLNGRKKGIFQTWDDCKRQVNGFKDAKFKGFRTLEEAQKYLGTSTSCREDKDAARPQAERNQRPPPDKARAIDCSPPDVKPVLKRPRVDGAVNANSVPNVWTVMIGFDGGSRGNPGVAGSGAEVVVVERTADGVQRARIKFHLREYLDSSSTNNMAEWKGSIIGLKQVVDHVRKFSQENGGVRPEIKLVVQGDSQLVIRQLEGRYKVNNAQLKRYKTEFESTLVQLKGIVSKVKISYQHVYRNDNGVADRLANEAMDAKRSWVTITEDREEESGKDEPPSKKTKMYADV